MNNFVLWPSILSRFLEIALKMIFCGPQPKATPGPRREHAAQSGQQFDTDNYNVIVAYGNCIHSRLRNRDTMLESHV